MAGTDTARPRGSVTDTTPGGLASPKSASAIELIDIVKEVRSERGLFVKELPSERILDGVNLVVPAGAITVLLGPSGAGKTVTVKHVLGLMQPSSGVVRVEGKDLAAISEDELNEVRRGMGVVLQGTLPFTCGLFWSLNVYENVAFPLRDRTRWTAERIDRVAMEHLDMVGLRDRAYDTPDQLSAGMCKRVALARALVLKPRIVVIDDFDSGLDAVRLSLLGELIRDLQRRTEATFFLTTHDMKMARELADYAAVIHEGRIVASGNADTVFRSTDRLVRQLVTSEPSGPLQLRDT
jgi:phospholipid/cholesterol/gamma-HCH transport system ATP-binding protein